jgi:hypothetical protein
LDAEIQSLSDTLINEIINAVGLPKTAGWHRIFDPLFQKAARQLAGIGVTFDRLIEREGFPSACAWALTHWCRDITARGIENIPKIGPLLVVSNHAGAYDSVVIASLLDRNDLKIIASDVAFLKNLPSTNQHFFYVSKDNPYHSMSAVRSGMRHLQEGGALLLFGTGLVDPDPAVYPGAEKEIEHWSPSIELFLRNIPDANLVATIVSGILSPRWAHHPITWLKRIDWQKRRLAEFGQVIQQLFFPGRLYISPQVSFAAPVTVTELHRQSGTDRVLPAILTRAKDLLAEHLAWTQTPLKE